MANTFVSQPLSSWLDTRNTLHGFAQVVGAVRGAMTIRERHWFNLSLRLSAGGFITPPILNGNEVMDIELNLSSHVAVIRTSRGNTAELAMTNSSVASFATELLKQMARLDIYPALDAKIFSEDSSSAYETQKVELFRNNLHQIDAALRQFKGTLKGATGPVQLWPHHFDLALLWFSGRVVPGTDPGDEEASEEQMNFGFSTGDDGIGDPYFYVTAYPFPEKLHETPLPKGATWNSTWKGSVLMLEAVAQSADPIDMLMTYWTTLQSAGSRWMQ